MFIFSNESISVEDGKHYCDNLDLKSIPEGLNGTFDVNLIARMSKADRKHCIKDYMILLNKIKKPTNMKIIINASSKPIYWVKIL